MQSAFESLRDYPPFQQLMRLMGRDVRVRKLGVRLEVRF
jgi:hypothetical protein